MTNQGSWAKVYSMLVKHVDDEIREELIGMDVLSNGNRPSDD
jgi:hypothetical protein